MTELDEHLMAQLAEGAQEPLKRLVRRHGTPLLSFLGRMTSDRHRAEELFQEVFLAVWVKRHQYHFPRPFKPWLYAIAINKCREAFRRRRPTPIPLSAETPGSAGASPSDALVAAELADLVGQAVTRLPPRQRAVVVLRIWEGMSYACIAQVVGCREATVRSHMHHGLAALRESLRPHVQPSPEFVSKIEI